MIVNQKMGDTSTVVRVKPNPLSSDLTIYQIDLDKVMIATKYGAAGIERIFRSRPIAKPAGYELLEDPDKRPILVPENEVGLRRSLS